MADEFLLSVKEELQDLPEYYQKLIDEKYKEYVYSKYDMGYSMTKIRNSFGDEKDIAKRYRFYYKLHQLHGRKKLKGAKALIKEALENKTLQYQYYSSKKSVFLFKSILMFILGIILSISGILFLIGNLDNPWGTPMSVIMVSVFTFGGGIASLYYISIMRHKFFNNMLAEAMDGCNLEYFGPDSTNL